MATLEADVLRVFDKKSQFAPGRLRDRMIGVAYDSNELIWKYNGVMGSIKGFDINDETVINAISYSATTAVTEYINGPSMTTILAGIINNVLGNYDMSQYLDMTTVENIIDEKVSIRIGGIDDSITNINNFLDGLNDDLATIAQGLGDHVTDNSVHITSTERNTWNAKQDALVEGANIHIENNVISAVDTIYDDTAIRNIIGGKQDALIEGANIHIIDNVISADDMRYDDSGLRSDIASITGDITNINTALGGMQGALTPGANIDITNGVISAVDTVYVHPAYTPRTSGLYKIAVTGEGHVNDAVAVTKADITALGIPGENTVYSDQWIRDLIPDQATENNKLADKAFVNSSISNMAARFVTPSASGDSQWPSLNALRTGPWYHQGVPYAPTQSDYAIFLKDVNIDPYAAPSYEVWRAAFDGVQWNEQYKVNDSPFTAAQLAAINSNITSTLVQKLDALPDNATLQTALNGKEPTITAGTNTDYWRGDKSWQDLGGAVRGTALTGLSTTTSAAITATDSVLVAAGKLQAQINTKGSGSVTSITAGTGLTGGTITTTGTIAHAAHTGEVTGADALTITANAVTFAKMQTITNLSVLGNATNTNPGAITAIQAGTDDYVLRRSGTTLGFGTVATGGIADNAVTNAKIRQSAGLSVLGRSANTTGNIADITAVTDGHVLRLSGTTLGFGTVVTAGIADNAITTAKIADSSSTTTGVTMAKIAQGIGVLGRNSNSNGAPAYLAPTAANTVLRGTGAGVYSWGALVDADIPSLSASKITATAGGIGYGNSSSQLAFTAAGTSGNVLVSGGSGAPSWRAAKGATSIRNDIGLGTLSSTLTPIHYLESNTAVGTAAKTISTDGGYTTRNVGDIIAVKFLSGNSATPTTLAAGGAAINMRFNGAALTAAMIPNIANWVGLFEYDGTYWVLLNPPALGITAGTVISGLTTNAVVYASSATNVASLTGLGTSGNVLKSSGTGAPNWGTVDLASTNNITGVLGAANGGLGVNATTSGVVYRTGTSGAFSVGALPVGQISASGTPGSGNYLRGDGQWAAVTATPAFSGLTQGGAMYANGTTTIASTAFTANGFLKSGASATAAPTWRTIAQTKSDLGLGTSAGSGDYVQRTGDSMTGTLAIERTVSGTGNEYLQLKKNDTNNTSYRNGLLFGVTDQAGRCGGWIQAFMGDSSINGGILEICPFGGTTMSSKFLAGNQAYGTNNKYGYLDAGGLLIQDPTYQSAQLLTDTLTFYDGSNSASGNAVRILFERNGYVTIQKRTGSGSWQNLSWNTTNNRFQ